jgi:hypothetical protein
VGARYPSLSTHPRARLTATEGGLRKSWLNRWFFLNSHDKTLIYYEKEKGVERGRVDLTKVTKMGYINILGSPPVQVCWCVPQSE